MATYFVGTCLDAISANTPYVTDTDTYVQVNGAADVTEGAICELVDPTTGGVPAVTELWTHLTLLAIGAGSSGNAPLVWRVGGTEVVRVTVGANTPATLKYKVGTSWVAAGTATLGNGQVCDFRFKPHATEGIVEMFIGGISAIRAEGVNTTALAGITSLLLARHTSGSSNNTRYSDILMADYNTIGAKISRKAPTADGTYKDWTGGYADVGDAALNDASYIAATAAGQRETFTGPAFAAAGGYKVCAVAVAARARMSTAAITSLKTLLQISGTFYPSPSLALGAGFGPKIAIYDKNPATQAAWTSVTAANGEFGVEAG